MRSIKPATRRLQGIENLESRNLMSVTPVVTVEQLGGLLKITGDNYDDNVIVRGYSDGRIDIRGDGGTQIRGPRSVGSQSFAGVSAIQVELMKGNDHLNIGGYGDPEFLALTSLRVDMGPGANGAQNVVVSNLRIFGDVTITAPGATSPLYVEFRGGWNHVQGKTTVAGGPGNDIVSFSKGYFDSIDVRLGNGDDNVTFEGGADVGNLVSRKVDVYLGAGGDSFNQHHMTVLKSITVNMGTGIYDDRAFIESTQFNGAKKNQKIQSVPSNYGFIQLDQYAKDHVVTPGFKEVKSYA